MIFLTGDTHGGADSGFRRFNTKNFPEQRNLTKDDYVIILGDFGALWSYPGTKNHKEDLYWQKWFKDKPWTTLFIDGNHENHDLLNDLEEVDLFGAKVGKVNNSIYHLKRGQIYTIEGKTFFVMGGAKSHDKENRTIGVSWWEDETPKMQQMYEGLDNLEEHNNKVDFVLTHTCPTEVADQILEQMKVSRKENDPTEKYLSVIKEKIDYKRWFFGHWHLNQSFGDLTCLYKKMFRL